MNYIILYYFLVFTLYVNGDPRRQNGKNRRQRHTHRTQLQNKTQLSYINHIHSVNYITIFHKDEYNGRVNIENSQLCNVIVNTLWDYSPKRYTQSYIFTFLTYIRAVYPNWEDISSQNRNDIIRYIREYYVRYIFTLEKYPQTYRKNMTVTISFEDIIYYANRYCQLSYMEEITFGFVVVLMAYTLL